MKEEQLIFNPGETILKQGDQGNGFYILEKGTLEVYRDDVLLSVLMYPGTIFGEMADILGKPRTCTIKAKNNAQVLHLGNIENMEEILRENPDVAYKIIKTLANRLERTTEKLADTTRESPLWSFRR